MSKIFPKNTTKDSEELPSIRKVRSYAVFSLVLILVISAISYWNASRIKYFTSEVIQAEKVLQSSDELYATILERETSIRGYILTGDLNFLENYEASIITGEELYRDIRQLTQDNLQQQAYLEKLKAIMEMRTAVFEQTKVYYQQNGSLEGFINEQRVENAVEQQKEVKDIIQNINITENENFQKKNASLINNMNALPFIVGLIALFSVTIGILTIFSLHHYDKAHRISNLKIKKYQESLQEKIELLNDSNRDLEQFAYVASHDLQEPLRKITSFSDLLIEQYQDKMQGDGELYLSRITAAANRMRLLITDLLEYSRAGRQGPSSGETISLNSILDTALDNLEVPISESKAEIEIGKLPKIHGNESELIRVFQNLLSNSIKFAQRDLPPKIKVSSSPASREMVMRFAGLDKEKSYQQLILEDNGIGFDPEYAEKIFTIFQRLHGKSEYEGTGIGLAITKKIIEKHGGEIFAEGKSNKGAKFNILLPDE